MIRAVLQGSEEERWEEGSAEAIRLLRAAGDSLFVVAHNQSRVGLHEVF